MKRRAVSLLVLLPLLVTGGAIVNVAVAWGCAVSLYANVQTMWTGYIPAEVPVWQANGWSRTGAARIISHPFDSKDPERSEIHDFFLRTGKLGQTDKPLPSWSRISETPTDAIHLETTNLVEDARGWPVLSMMCSFERSEWEDTPDVEVRTRLGIPLENGPAFVLAGDEHRALPLRPIWPGFAINTILYASILWVMFFTPGKVRRTIRRKRGLCRGCAYPVGASPVCTECGCPLEE